MRREKKKKSKLHAAFAPEKSSYASLGNIFPRLEYRQENESRSARQQPKADVAFQRKGNPGQ